MAIAPPRRYPAPAMTWTSLPVTVLISVIVPVASLPTHSRVRLAASETGSLKPKRLAAQRGVPARR